MSNTDLCIFFTLHISSFLQDQNTSTEVQENKYWYLLEVKSLPLQQSQGLGTGIVSIIPRWEPSANTAIAFNSSIFNRGLRFYRFMSKFFFYTGDMLSCHLFMVYPWMLYSQSCPSTGCAYLAADLFFPPLINFKNLSHWSVFPTLF